MLYSIQCINTNPIYVGRSLHLIFLLVNSLHIGFSRVYTTSPLSGDGFVYAFNGVIMSRSFGKLVLIYTLSQTLIISMSSLLVVVTFS